LCLQEPNLIRQAAVILHRDDALGTRPHHRFKWKFQPRPIGSRIDQFGAHLGLAPVRTIADRLDLLDLLGSGGGFRVGELLDERQEPHQNQRNTSAEAHPHAQAKDRHGSKKPLEVPTNKPPQQRRKGPALKFMLDHMNRLAAVALLRLGPGETLIQLKELRTQLRHFSRRIAPALVNAPLFELLNPWPPLPTKTALQLVPVRHRNTQKEIQIAHPRRNRIAQFRNFVDLFVEALEVLRDEFNRGPVVPNFTKPVAPGAPLFDILSAGNVQVGLVDRDMRPRQWPPLTRSKLIPGTIHIEQLAGLFILLRKAPPPGQHFVRNPNNPPFRVAVPPVMPSAVIRKGGRLHRHI